MFRRTRYQHGSVEREERKKGPAVWVYRWWGRRHQRETGASQSPGWGYQEIPDRICGTVSSRRSSANHQQSLRTQEPAANRDRHALGALLSRGVASQSVIHTGCVHNLRKELDCPTLAGVIKEQVKTVEVERWLRATGVADGTKAKIKCVMSALFSHAVRWEFCGHNPISSGIPVGTGGKRGPSTGVRISAKRRRSPLVLSPEQLKCGLAELEFRDQLLVFLEGALGIRQGELGALRWLECDFENMSFSVQH